MTELDSLFIVASTIAHPCDLTPGDDIIIAEKSSIALLMDQVASMKESRPTFQPRRTRCTVGEQLEGGRLLEVIGCSYTQVQGLFVGARKDDGDRQRLFPMAMWHKLLELGMAGQATMLANCELGPAL